MNTPDLSAQYPTDATQPLPEPPDLDSVSPAAQPEPTTTDDAARTRTPVHAMPDVVAPAVPAPETPAPPAPPPWQPPRVRPEFRLHTVLWGLIVIAAGIVTLAAVAGVQMDPAVVAIGFLAAAGLTLILGSIAQSLRRARRRDPAPYSS